MITGFTGKARSGKDTAAKLLADITGQELYALAKPIKDVIGTLFGWDDKHLDGTYKEIEIVYPISPDSLDKAGEVYNSYGLDKYEAFHDCWEKLTELFNINTSNSRPCCIISPRRAFQLFGTEWGRSISDTIWLDIAPKDNVIITDVRFDNEAKYFKDKGASIVKMIRVDIPEVNKHVSERGVSRELVDAEVFNTSTLKDLSRIMKYLAEESIPSGIYSTDFQL